MPIVGVMCNCHASEPLFRQFLFSNHVANYLSVPVFKGDKAKQWAKDNNLSDLKTYIDKHSSYAVIVGWTNTKDVAWEDINNVTPERELRAEMLLERFATKNIS